MTLITSNDRFAIFGARGMAGSAISRALSRAGYHHQLNPCRADLELLDPQRVKQWFIKHQPTVVVLAAAKASPGQAQRLQSPEAAQRHRYPIHATS